MTRTRGGSAVERTTAVDEPSTPGVPTHSLARSATRRQLLQAARGVCVILLGGTLYRAYDQGVFSAGEGPAYDAWRDFSAREGAGQLMLVRAAVLATNAHNTQPWLFQLRPAEIELYAVPDRNIG